MNLLDLFEYKLIRGEFNIWQNYPFPFALTRKYEWDEEIRETVWFIEVPVNYIEIAKEMYTIKRLKLPIERW